MAERVLLVSSRFPWPAITGDRIRLLAWLEALGPLAEVTLVAPPGRVPADAPRLRFVPAPRSAAALAAGAVRVASQGLPATALLAAGHHWRDALGRAAAGADFDAAVVLLARLDPWVFPHLRARRRVFDAIDSLAANLEERAGAARGPARAWWRWESRRTAALERDAVRRYDRTVVVAAAERERLGAGVEAVFHGVRIGPVGGGPRPFDLGFWGRLAYFANRDAVETLASEVWPRVRRARPDARLLVAGADAPRSIRRLHGRDGITVVSPIADRDALLRQVKVAVFPLRYGSGQSNKVLEAAEASCALVATPEALRGLDAIAAVAAVASEPAVLADRALELLAGPETAPRSGARLRAVVEREYSRESACRRLAAIALGAGGPISG
ncbi:MAG TPA: glycosyltransferase [Thermoanaerobaculaceae bacterium]|nr:glycosyltransferase [Thermoanaerobaculaceae bacterium]